jgi:hypothetical protein
MKVRRRTPEPESETAPDHDREQEAEPLIAVVSDDEVVVIERHGALWPLPRRLVDD